MTKTYIKFKVASIKYELERHDFYQKERVKIVEDIMRKDELDNLILTGRFKDGSVKATNE